MSVTVNCLTGPATYTSKTDRILPARLAAPITQDSFWHPALLGGVLWRGLTHIKIHREILHFLFRCPPLAEFVIKNPGFACKYLTPRYLARGFTVPERACCFLHHYQQLFARMPDSLFRQTLQENITIHEISESAHCFTISLGLSRPYNTEGELSLNLHVDGVIVFVLGFTIAPGSVVQSPAREVMLVTRLQGVKDTYTQIALATKALHDVAPSALLLAALQGVADAFGIGEIVAVSAVRQSSYRIYTPDVFLQAYDEFFSEVGMSKTANGFYRTSVPIQGKPLTSIKHGHKLRTKEKRAFKQQIQSACARFLGAC